MLENVEEFKTWGPLNRGHHPIKAKQGDTFRQFVKQLNELGYEYSSESSWRQTTEHRLKEKGSL